MLSQYSKDRVLRAVGYFSQKHDAAQANYTIHDKELLAVMKCLAQWDVELKMVRKFTVITDHKNLEYFTTRRLLSERHIHWADTLSIYNLTFVYQPGKVNGRADAMSYKEENTPAGRDNDRMMSREFWMPRPVTKQEFTEYEREAGALLCFLAQIAFSCPVRQSNWFPRVVCGPVSSTTKELARAQDEIVLDTRSRIQPRAVTPGENSREGDEDTSARQ
jgi:hypothetical protein